MIEKIFSNRDNIVVKTQRIGAVKVTYLKTDRQESPICSDSDVEDRLYNRFRAHVDGKHGPEGEIYSCWAEEYHLSPVRHNLLKWYPFNREGSVLEIGAGCGALTGFLCGNLRDVVALEYCEKRALVTAHRHAHSSNLEVLVGGLQDLYTQARFDYITVIGVLEHAWNLYEGERPYETFLAKVVDLLNPTTGTILLTIENKIGPKYLGGAHEDRTKRVFNSIYSYPCPSKVNTFSKEELTALLKGAGFRSLRWYYPFPDSNMPKHVISEDVRPSDADEVWPVVPLNPGKVHSSPVLSETRLCKSLAREGLFWEFANSLLVEASLDEKPSKRHCLRFVGANRRRRPEYRTTIAVYEDGGEKMIVKCREGRDSNGFLGQIAQREALAKAFFFDRAEVVTGRLEEDRLVYPYVEFPSLENHIAEAIKAGDPTFAREWVDSYVRFLRNLPSETCVPTKFMQEFDIAAHEIPDPVECVKSGIFDCIPRNIKVGPKCWLVIDNEWTYDYSIPIDYIVFRGLGTLVVGLQKQIQTAVRTEATVVLFWGWGQNRQYMPTSWFEIVRESALPPERMIRWERHFQRRIFVGSSNLRLRLKREPKVLTRIKLLGLPDYGRIFRRFGRGINRAVRAFI